MYFVPESMFWWTSTRLQHRLNRRLRINHRCIGCTMFQKTCLSWSVNLFSTGWTDAPTEHAPVQWRKPGYCVRTPTATNWTQRDRLNRCFHFLTRRFFRWSRFFCSGLPTAMWPFPLYIRAPLAHLNCLWRIEYLRPPLRRRESALSKRVMI